MIELQAKYGPLKVWQWVAAGAAGIVAAGYLAKLRAKSSGGGIVTLMPNPSGASATDSSPYGPLGGMLGALQDFLCGVPNAPNQVALQLPDGTEFQFGNGVPTFGSGNPQTVLSGDQSVSGQPSGWCGKPPDVPPDTGGDNPTPISVPNNPFVPVLDTPAPVASVAAPFIPPLPSLFQPAPSAAPVAQPAPAPLYQPYLPLNPAFGPSQSSGGYIPGTLPNQPGSGGYSWGSYGLGHPLLPGAL